MKHQHELEKLLTEYKKPIRHRPISENIVIKKDGFYYKFPKFKKLFLGKQESYHKKMSENIGLIHTYFNDICEIAPSEILEYKDSYVIKQKHINAQKITREIVENNNQIKNTLLLMLQRNEQMRKKHKLSLDLTGTDIITDPFKLHNIITDGKKLFIIDLGLLDASNNVALFTYISKLFYFFQQRYVSLLT